MSDDKDVLMKLVERSARQEQQLASFEEGLKQLVDAVRDLAVIEKRHVQTSAAVDQARQDVARLFELYHEQSMNITTLASKLASSEPMARLTTRIVFGAAGLILTAVLVAIIAVVVG